MKLGTLSVVMANYNHARYVGQALTALLGQNVRPQEVIVIDDGSADDSVAVIQAVAQTDPLVRLLCNDRNRGFFYSVARALEIASGDYLFFAAADDYVLPGFVEKSMELLARHPQAGLSCGYCSTVDGVTGKVYTNPVHWGEQPCFLAPDEIAGRIGSACIPGHTAVIKRTSYLEAGGHRPELKWHSDWLLNLSLAFRHGLCFIPETVALFRTLPTSFSAVGVHNRHGQVEVLSRLLDFLLSPIYADVLPLFQTSGALAHFGANLVVTAVGRQDRWERDLLTLTGCLPFGDYESLLSDEDAEVRELAAFFVRTLTPWQRQLQQAQTMLRQTQAEREEAQAHLQQTRDQLQQARDALAGIESSKFWKVRTAWVKIKGVLKRLAARQAGGMGPGGAAGLERRDAA